MDRRRNWSFAGMKTEKVFQEIYVPFSIKVSASDRHSWLWNTTHMARTKYFSDPICISESGLACNIYAIWNVSGSFWVVEEFFCDFSRGGIVWNWLCLIDLCGVVNYWKVVNRECHVVALYYVGLVWLYKLGNKKSIFVFWNVLQFEMFDSIGNCLKNNFGIYESVR